MPLKNSIFEVTRREDAGLVPSLDRCMYLGECDALNNRPYQPENGWIAEQSCAYHEGYYTIKLQMGPK